MSDRLLAVGMIVMGVGALAGVVGDWRRGKVYDAYGSYRRDRGPASYWALVAAWTLVSLVLLIGGIWWLLQ